MRPVRLTLQAFGPYAGREVVDFRSAAEAGLFGIYGSTGSGKSSIFSAMTFALFGQAARKEQDATSLRSAHAEPDMPTEVEFVFDVGERRYVVVRRPRQSKPKRGGGETDTSHEAHLFDATGLAPEAISEPDRGKVIEEKKVSQVDRAVEEILGYGPNQFRQIVLLPQGRFEAFLSANTNDRLTILRDLFDVSLYQRLMVELKAKAADAEATVRDARTVSAGRLQAEGFESMDALSEGLTVAEADYDAKSAQELQAQKDAKAAAERLNAAKALDKHFEAFEAAKAARLELEEKQDEFEALAAQVKRASEARFLLDVDAQSAVAAKEAEDARKALAAAQETAEIAAQVAKTASEALETEKTRDPERDAARRTVDRLARFKNILDQASQRREALEEARQAERSAAAVVRKIKDTLTSEVKQQSEQSKTLKERRKTEALRRELRAEAGELKTALTKTQVAEAALKSLEEARKAQASADSALKEAEVEAERAGEAKAAAERDLTASQARLLALSLEPGEPCPVCGSVEHRAPAGEASQDDGLEQRARQAGEAWVEAERRRSAAASKRAGLKTAVEERSQRFAELETPDETAAVLAARLESLEGRIEALGPPTDLEAAETELEALAHRIEKRRCSLEAAQAKSAARVNERSELSARLDEALAEVPGPLRDPEALAAETQTAEQAFAALERALSAATDADRKARDAQLRADQEKLAAERATGGAEERARTARDSFEARLAQAELSEAGYLELKPAIETLEDDIARVEAFRRQVDTAETALSTAAEAVAGVDRPNLSELQAETEATEKVREGAQELRATAKAKRDHLSRLRQDLENEAKRADELEAETGPLRDLAQLVNGSNDRKLTLEIYAIAAMFDRVLEAANLRLGPMTSGRYRLEREAEGSGRGARGLGIAVYDLFTGKPRPTSTLSGGESFIAALALALGLADVVESSSGKLRLDTIFIDEGFGSLDTENGAGTLDQVLTVLQDLVGASRSVGVISHVPMVQEAIPNGFYVRKTGEGSQVEERRSD